MNEKCEICGQYGIILYKFKKDLLYNTEGKWNIIYCDNCGFAWLDPKPSVMDFEKLYENYHTQFKERKEQKIQSTKKFQYVMGKLIFHYKIQKSVIFKLITGNSNIKKKFAGNFLSKLIRFIPYIQDFTRYFLMNIEPPSCPGLKLLDVGCGSGWFVQLMNDIGFEAYGIEPDEIAAKIAKENTSENVKITQGFLSDNIYENNYFDYITLRHVIEHLGNPEDTLLICFKLLKPGGKLYIQTPNLNSLGHLAFKEYWRGLEIPRHIYIYSNYSVVYN